MNSKRREKVKLGHVVQIAAHVTLKFSIIIYFSPLGRQTHFLKAKATFGWKALNKLVLKNFCSQSVLLSLTCVGKGREFGRETAREGERSALLARPESSSPFLSNACHAGYFVIKSSRLLKCFVDMTERLSRKQPAITPGVKAEVVHLSEIQQGILLVRTLRTCLVSLS